MTQGMMIDVVKVRKALWCCSQDGCCEECPFCDDVRSRDYSGCREMHRQAYRLLKPRLLTSEELRSGCGPFAVWIEYRDHVMEMQRLALITGSYCSTNYEWVVDVRGDRGTWSGYNKSWRCWTQWPSEEDRRREAWDDEH